MLVALGGFEALVEVVEAAAAAPLVDPAPPFWKSFWKSKADFFSGATPLGVVFSVALAADGLASSPFPANPPTTFSFGSLPAAGTDPNVVGVSPILGCVAGEEDRVAF